MMLWGVVIINKAGVRDVLCVASPYHLSSYKMLDIKDQFEPKFNPERR